MKVFCEMLKMNGLNASAKSTFEVVFPCFEDWTRDSI